MASTQQLILPDDRFRLEEVNMSEELAVALAGQAVVGKVLPEEQPRPRHSSPLHPGWLECRTTSRLRTCSLRPCESSAVNFCQSRLQAGTNFARCTGYASTVGGIFWKTLHHGFCSLTTTQNARSTDDRNYCLLKLIELE